MGRQNQIVVVDDEIAHRSMRQIQLQRLPLLPVVEGDPHRVLGGGVQQAAALRVLAHRVHRGIRQRTGQRLPALAAVDGAINVRM